MEVRETAACGISERQFAIECDTDELADIYRLFHYIVEGLGHYDEDVVDDLTSQMEYIVGNSVTEEPSADASGESIAWQEGDLGLDLIFSETDGSMLFQLFQAAEHPGEGFNEKLNKKLMDQMMELAPSTLENLPIINR